VTLISGLLQRDPSWIFGVFARVYAWFTAQAAWRGSCALLATHLAAPHADQALTVVDLGCGPGVSTLEMARRRPDARYIGLDRAAQMLAQARSRERQAGLGASHIHWLHADASTLPFLSDSIDALTGHSFLYLLGQPRRARVLVEMERVLRPGGRVVLMEPSAQPATLGQILRVSADPRHLVSVLLWRPFSRLHLRYTPELLRSTLRQSGFVEVRVEEVLGGLGLMASGQKPVERAS
jgi:ubiquinone/menaquinone biosynthesis C-methylase UbiE